MLHPALLAGHVLKREIAGTGNWRRGRRRALDKRNQTAAGFALATEVPVAGLDVVGHESVGGGWGGEALFRPPGFRGAAGRFYTLLFSHLFSSSFPTFSAKSSEIVVDFLFGGH